MSEIIPVLFMIAVINNKGLFVVIAAYYLIKTIRHLLAK